MLGAAARTSALTGSPSFSDHSSPGLLIALQGSGHTLESPLDLEGLLFLGSPQGFQLVLVLKMGSPHIQQQHLGAEMQIPGPPSRPVFHPTIHVGWGVLSSVESGTDPPPGTCTLGASQSTGRRGPGQDSCGSPRREGRPFCYLEEG